MPPRASIALIGTAMLFPVAATTAQDQELVPTAALRPLEAIAIELKKSNLEREAADVVALLTGLGHSTRSLEQLEKRVQKTRVGRSKPRFTSLIGRIHKAATRLAESIPADGPGRETVARSILALDGSVAAAHAALGDELVAGVWESAADRAVASRRAEIMAAVDGARTLEVEIQTHESANPVLTGLAKARDKGAAPFPVSNATFENVTLHMAAEPQRVARVLRQAVRTTALIQWMLDGQLRIPERKNLEVVILRSVDTYREAVRVAVKDNGLTKDDSEAYEVAGEFRDRRGFLVFQFYREEEAVAWLAHLLLPERRDFVPLWEGMLNWASMSLLNVWMPRGPSARYSIDFGRYVGEIEITLDSGMIHPRIYYVGDDADEHSRLAWSGLTGTYRWLAHLNEFKRSKPWQKCFTDIADNIAGNQLLKSTSMAHMLLEDGHLDELLTKVGPTANRKGPEVRAKVEEALKTSLTDLEQRWQSWVRPTVPSLAEKLAQADSSAASDAQRAVHEALVKLRATSVQRRPDVPDWPLMLDHQLSIGAAAHAAYLREAGIDGNPWPSGHTEVAGEDGHSRHGAHAARNSLIATDVERPVEGLEALMATITGRCHLLEPALTAVGIGFQDGILVVDAGSMVAPSFEEWLVRWPHRDMKDVPTHYHPLGPNPVPDRPIAELGYPITVQMGQRQRGPSLRLTMKLFEVRRSDKTEVECAFLSPESAPAPELELPRTFCLVPLKPLEPRTTYEVVVTLPDDQDDHAWEFTTRR